MMHTLTLPNFQLVYFVRSPRRATNNQQQQTKNPGKKKPLLPQLPLFFLLLIGIIFVVSNRTSNELDLEEHQKDHYTLLEEAKANPRLHATSHRHRIALRYAESSGDTLAERILREYPISKRYFHRHKDHGLQPYNPFPDEGKLVLANHKQAEEKFEGGHRVYYPRNLSQKNPGRPIRVKYGHIFVPWLEYCYLEPIPKDNINNL